MKEMKPVRYHIGDMPETSKQTASRHDEVGLYRVRMINAPG
ncbi:TPA: hypothetical protein ACFU25_001241 [Neisseria meningitidis]